MEVAENKIEYLDDFIRLNEEWISTHFVLEDVDFNLAVNPGKIIDDGGYIFTLLSNSSVQVVCALFNHADGEFELARMAVSPSAQGKGCGDKLMLVTLAKLKELRALRVFLMSNTKLDAAISLYKKHGFEVVSLGQHPVYSRANITMEKYVS